MEREQLHDFVLFAVNIGLRPDEARGLQFCTKIGRCKAQGNSGNTIPIPDASRITLHAPDTSQRVRDFSMTLLAGSISIQRSSLNYCEWVSS
jgi:hypothetical protein